MQVKSQGTSIQSLYNGYKETGLFVNRVFQRKLVWPTEFKRKLIDSLLNAIPIPLVIIAETERGGTKRKEIIDGLQRLNAIFGFIEHQYLLEDESYFDLQHFITARLSKERGEFFEYESGIARLSAENCAKILNYELPVTTIESSSDQEITEVFSRINSYGRQLSNQERRQAGIVSPFANLVREVAAEVRGDSSSLILPLGEMPKISIEMPRGRQGHCVRPEDSFWCKHKIIRSADLREGVDEESIAYITAAILKGEPLPRSGDSLDRIYDPDDGDQVVLNAYLDDARIVEIKSVISAITEQIMTIFESEDKLIGHHIYGSATGNPVTTLFFFLFMAFYKLNIEEKMRPENSSKITQKLSNIRSQVKTDQSVNRPSIQKDQINIVASLMRDHFRDVGDHDDFPKSVIIEFEKILYRAGVETATTEFKQGVMTLFDPPSEDAAVYEKVIKTACGIANSCQGVGQIVIGVADKKQHAERIFDLRGVKIRELAGHYITGIDHECKDGDIDGYIRKWVFKIDEAPLNVSFKGALKTSIKLLRYIDRHVLLISIPKQDSLSFYEDRAFVRYGSELRELKPQEIAAAAQRFPY